MPNLTLQGQFGRISGLSDAEIRQLTEKSLKVLGWGYGSVTFELEDAKTPDRLIDQVAGRVRNRRRNYGRPLVNFLRIAVLWSEYNIGYGLNIVFTPEDVAWMMVLLKIARQEHSDSEDNLLDSLGYVDCLDDMHKHMAELGYEWEFLSHCGVDGMNRLLIEIQAGGNSDLQAPQVESLSQAVSATASGASYGPSPAQNRPRD